MSYLANLDTAPEIHARIASAARARRLALNMTQDALAERSGVAIATLRRFEAGGTASLATVLAIAEALDALDAFARAFPVPEAKTLDDLQAPPPERARASRRRSS